MSSDIEQVTFTPNEALEPCPFCGGRVHVEQLEFDWGPYDLRKSKFRCVECEAMFEYQWRPSPWKHVPHAIEWWNTRKPAQIKEYQGYSIDQLQAVVDLLKEKEITPDHLSALLLNLRQGVHAAKIKFTRDLYRHLQAILENDNTPEELIKEVDNVY